ncbi:hypothetical protein [Saccharopolyspora hattusasensis]|uniref:hypothetical protein n=1 Tax=Saccharopolyspora hattusasensis TaxID=1128679 RepID=UPI003D98EC44
MAKNQMMPFQMPKGGGTGKKVLGLLFVAAVVILVVKHPTDAAQWVKEGWATATAAAEGVATFLQGVIGQ